MEYQEVWKRTELFQEARRACSREWRLTEHLVMCTELDMTAVSDLTSAPVHSRILRRRGPRLIRISFFRWLATPEGWWQVLLPGAVERQAVNFHAWLDKPADNDSEPMDAQERAEAERYRETIWQWASGDLSELPPSTSEIVAKRLRMR